MAEPSAELLKMMESPASTTPTPAETKAEPIDTQMSGDETPPMASPMSTPEPKMGSREASLINIGMAMDLLEQSISAIGSDTEEGKKILNALKSLTAVVGERKNSIKELQQSEILQMLQALPQAGGATPESKALAQAPQIPGMGAGPQGLPPSPGPV
jgi:hypothetical protein